MRRQPRPGAPGAVTFGVLAVSVAAFALLQSLVLPVLASFERAYDTDQSTVTWLLTGYLLSAAIATPLVGRIGDVVGKTRMLAATLVVLSLGCALAALAPSIGWLIAARVVQGLGGGVLPLAFGIAHEEFRSRGTAAIAVLASLASMGFGFGIVVAGPIVDLLGLAGLFWIPMVTCALACLATVLFVRPSSIRTPARLPVVPAILLAVWLVALLLGLSKGNAWGWTAPQVLGLLATAAVVAAVWILVELHVPVPMIDMRMMARRGVWTSNAVGAFVGFGMFASLGFLPQMIQTPTAAGYGFGASIGESGFLLLPTAAASFVVGFWASPLIGRYGARTVIAGGGLAMASAFTVLALWHDEPWQVVVATTLQGAGSGLVFSSIAGVVVSSVPPQQAGVASAMNANIRSIGGSLGSAVMAGIVTTRVGTAGFPFERGYTLGFAVLATVTVCGAIVALAIPDRWENPSGSALVDAGNGELGVLPGGTVDARRH